MTHAQNHLYPLTSPQREIWFDQMLHPSLPLYNVGGYMQIDGAVDPKLFEQAVNLLVQRHDALRTVLVPTSDIPMQTFLEDCPVTVPFHDFSGENDPRQAALVFMEQQVVQPFDLYEKPLCHFALLKIDENCFFCFGKYHHLIVDGWSIALITQSLAEIYTQLIRGQFCDRVAPSYLAFVQNDRAYIESSLYEVHRQYWLEKYQTLPEPLFTPRYLSQFVEQIAPSECQVLWLPRPFYNRLLALAKNTQSTLFHVMLGALYVYFTRTTQREELAIGLPVLNRSNASFKETMGLFIGVSAAWFQFGTQLSFRQLLKAIGKVLKSDYRRQRLPISELNRALGIHKMGRRQLFDLQLNYAKQEHVTEFEAFKTKSTTLTNDHEQTPLSISVWEFHENENVQVDFVYNLAYFDAAEIERIQSRFMLILEYVLTHVDESIRTIPLLTKSEQQQLVAWNDTAVDYPHDKTIIDLFEEQVDKTPDAIAVVFEDQQLTYRELNKKANQLAHYLLNLKTGTDNCSLITDNCLVGICIERSFEMVIGLLGILKAGGAYVPLDPAYPAARLAFMLDDAQVPVLLTQSSLTEKLPETQALEVCLDAETETLSQKSSENIVNGVGPENLAYVIYTSGSTGNPKGVLIAHQGLCNLAQAQIKLFQVQSDSRILQFASLGFDVAISDITMALCSGATLGLVTQNSIMSPEELIRILGKLSITHLEIPASVLGTFPLEKLPSLQTLIVGGETCSPTLVEQWSKGRRFFNAYGPTEGTVCATVFENTAGSTSTLPIGHPIANTQTYILDQNAQPLPVGVPGELHISGAGLARGYLNRPDLTAEKFIKNPFSDAPNWLRRSKDSRLYKTGDLARYLPDGNIEYLGRIDNQVKMRGFRIELGEIEAILVQHPAVQENAVIVHELESGDKRLVACLVPNQGQTIDNTELRSFLKDRLPDYMIPKAFVTLEALPLTPNGKIDRRALSQLSVSHEISEEQFVAPRTPEEELLAGIFAEVLGIERVGLFDNFFELGGHSLLATQVISRIRDTFSCELPLRELFESATVSNLANQIEANRFDKPSAPPIQMIDRTGNMPLSFAQQRLWFLNQLSGESAAYNIPAALHIEGPLQQNALVQSLAALVERHESLRTVFPTKNGTPVVQLSEGSFKLSVISLLDLPQSEIEVEVQKLINEDAQRPFDLEKGPLFRTTLLHTVRNESYVLLVNMHHIISDGWSLSVLIREFSTFYEAFLQNQPSPLPPLPIQYVDFAHWQRQWLSGEVLEKQVNYWKQQLAGIPALLELPTDHPRPPIQGFQGASLPISLSLELTTQLKQISQKTGTTLFMTLWSAFATLLSRYTGQSDIVIGSPIANRTMSVTESLIGFFVNTLVLRLDLTDNPPFEDILLKARRVALEAYSHQDIPFEQLVEALQPERNLSHSPLFQVMFVLQNAPIADLELAGLSLTLLEPENLIAKFDLTLELTETVSGLSGRLEYNTDLFERATIERLSGHLQTLLTGIVENPKTPIHELRLLTKAEHQQLLAWNDTATDYPHDKTIIDLFEEQVDKTPDAIAVVFEEQQLTYRKLNQKANQLAHYLISLKSDDNGSLITDNCLVGICIERSLEMVIGLLGILKVGGAYLPLDPAYPTARLAFMLEDAQVPVLLTQSSLKEKLPETQAQVVCLDAEAETLSQLSSENVVSGVGPENLAYVIYTSGSTGQPKGVAIEHRNVVALLEWSKTIFTLEQISGTLLSTSLNFDVSVFELFVPLCRGGKIILVENILSLSTLSEKAGVVMVNTVPSAMKELIKINGIPASVRVLNLAGEPFSPQLVQELYQIKTIQQIINIYGPTEDTVYATFTLLSQSPHEKLTIGRPISNAQTYILAHNLQSVPIGVLGELHLGGAGVARGYLNCPELTAEKFIKNPFSDDPNSRLYKTGDLARYLPDGNIEYLGRIDNQVKMRGFRIELGEIEAVLGQHPNVQQSVVITREDQPGNQRLVAYIVSDFIPERIPYQTECLAKWDGNTLKLRTEDISKRGVLLGGAVTFDENQELSLHLRLPGEFEARWLKGKVAWLQQTSWAGIEFTLTPNEQTLLNQSIKYLLETQGILKILQRLLTGNLRDYLKEKLPHYMVPSHFELLNALPLTPNGKIDRSKLSAPLDSPKPERAAMPQTEVEQLIATVWQEVLHVDKVGIYDNFFDLGGHSLLIIQVQAKLQKAFAKEISVVELFEHPTIHALAQHLGQTQCTPEFIPEPQPSRFRPRPSSNDIAIIGMSGRFPGATDIEAFWQNLQHGVESITFFADEELQASGIDTTTLNKPNYVKASAVLSDIDAFDALFFDINPKEAEMTDPQQRLFLECAWEAIENAGYEAGPDEQAIGVYAGVGMNTYLLNNLSKNSELKDTVDAYQVLISNGNDFLPTRVSYKLNLTGPSVNVQTACSTSLVAVSLACDSLLNGHCDMALAGGVSIRVPHKSGYLYQEGMILSPDGHCRAFDAKAQGTVGGNGVGIVVLKRLEEAIADGDSIQAIIKGSATNNDGALKVGYTAPSVKGQALVISEAQALAGIEPETISYIETHGTGTELGDPIEIAALTKAFQTEKTGFCAIGSLKSNIGHTDAAAGVAGLIKTVLALKHQVLPPSLHFEQPNPQIDFANSPFYVNTTLSEWKTNGTPRRAGVSSFGIGGTNAHVILEEAPTPEPSGQSRPWQLLVLSAKTASALESATANLAKYLAQHPDINLADVAYTLSKGRQAFNQRRMLICQNLDEATTALRTLEPTSVLTHSQALKERPVVFMFSGQGAQYVNMGLELYQTEPSFREQVDFCSEYLKPHLGLDLRQVLYPNHEEHISEATQQLNQTAITQTALFVIEYALAKLWMAWGIYPEAMIGHSIGEYVAACLSGVFSLEEALSLVAARGQMMQDMPHGAMLAVSLPEEKVQSYLGNGLSLAAINTPSLCVVSGFTEAVDALETQLSEQSVECRRLHTSHAFHSEMMAPILAPFTERVAAINFCGPKMPYLSNVTGNWITAAEATDPSYWSQHLRQTVRFADGLQQLLKNSARILLEVGPGRTLTTNARRHPDKAAEQVVLSSLRHPQEQQSDVAFLLNTVGKLWLHGGQVDWSGFYANERRYRRPLPTYPFERQRYWIEPSKPHDKTADVLESAEISKLAGKKAEIADWFYQPLWKQSVQPVRQKELLSSWLIFEDSCGLAAQLVKKLEQADQDVITVKVGPAFTQINDHHYTLNPQNAEEYEALIKALRTRIPENIVHLWTVTPSEHPESGLETYDQAQALGFYSLLFLAQALGKQNVTENIQIAVVSNNMQDVIGEEVLHPEKATVLGPVKVIGQEYPNLNCRSIDIPLYGTEIKLKLIDQLLTELTSNTSDRVIAYRGKHRWIQTFEPIRLDKPVKGTQPLLRKGGVYLITGGLGGIGLTLAEHLAKTVQAKLILIGRSAFPAKEEWNDWLTAHDEHDSVSRKIKQVQTLEAQGADVLVASADVANSQHMQEVITRAEERFGAINGVIHSAGIADGALIPRRTREMTETVFAPKVKGTLVLDSLLKNVELDFFILCSSLASIFGIGGQIGYCAANAFLDAFAHQQTDRGDTLTLSINWDTWQEVGMAVEALKPLTGVLDSPKLDTAKAMSHPLFDYCIADNSDQAIYITHFSLSKHWVLSEHGTKGKGLLPGTAYLEMVRAAVEKHAKNGTIELQQVYFLAPLQVGQDEEKEVWTFLKKQGEQHFEFSIKSRLNAEQWQTHAMGEIFCITGHSPKQYDLKAIAAQCPQEMIIPEDVQPQVDFIEFGPRWKSSIKQVKLGEKEELVLLELPEIFAADLNAYYLHPALLDAAAGIANIDYFYPAWREWQSGLTDIPDFLQNEGVYYMPFSYQKLIIKGAMPRRIYSYVRFLEKNSAQKEVQNVHLIIMDEQGTELLEIQNYMLRAVELDKLDSQQPHEPDVPHSPLVFGMEERKTAMTTLRQENFKEGLLPSEGVEVFNRILGSAGSQVLVSTRDLQSRFEQNDVASLLNSLKEAEPEQLSKPAHSRPQLSNAYVAPRNEMEQKLADIWQKFLGIDQVGIFDDFFELGGDSLVAVQLIASLRETLQKEVSATNLLNSPNIAALVESLEITTQSTGPAFPTILIEIQAGNRQKTPLFLMHPLGGHVFAYRDLAHELGSEQPVYGLQAQGFEGEAELLTRVEDMATLYIEALRVRQPSGPYFLGGTSFGGMIAFEMAQQLHALGQKVAWLIMMDTPGPGKMPQKVKADAKFFVYLVDLMFNVSVSLDEIQKLDIDERLLYVWEKEKKISKRLPDFNLTQLRRIHDLFEINNQAMWDYQPQIYPGRIIFFHAKERDTLLAKNPERAWIDLAQEGLEVIDVPGNHFTMNFSPHVQVIAERLRAYLEESPMES